ncbi:MAG TPA: NTP transferase domain-containing protein, partial [Thiolinea sp.]|nr:NTP transferase domain-containing protein [Thiolinea sp.]
MSLIPIILAAGQGTRMRSALPKVLHPLAGKPLLQHVIDACCASGVTRAVIVYGHGGEQVQQAVHADASMQLDWALQAEQKGTGHAVAQGMATVADDDTVLVAYGDVPLVRSQTLEALAQGLEGSALCVLTTMVTDPSGYGRIVRD